jgi:hypothetical protein
MSHCHPVVGVLLIHLYMASHIKDKGIATFGRLKSSGLIYLVKQPYN